MSHQTSRLKRILSSMLIGASVCAANIAIRIYQQSQVPPLSYAVESSHSYAPDFNSLQPSKLRYEEGNFSATFPGKPEAIQFSASISGDELVQSHIFIDESGVYQVACIDEHPDLATPLEERLLGEIEEFRSKTSDGILEQSDIEIDGVHGVSLSGQCEMDDGVPGRFRSRILLTEQRRYYVMTMAPEDQINEDKIEDFLTSFQFLTPPVPVCSTASAGSA